MKEYKRYPENKPTKSGEHLVIYKNGTLDIQQWLTFEDGQTHKIIGSCFIHRDAYIIAFMEIPDYGYLFDESQETTNDK